jgi:hypothetical protein
VPPENFKKERAMCDWLVAMFKCGVGSLWQNLYINFFKVLLKCFLLALTWILAAFGKGTRETWVDVILSYHNMCHLDNLRYQKKDLPLPGQIIPKVLT